MALLQAPIIIYNIYFKSKQILPEFTTILSLILKSEKLKQQLVGYLEEVIFSNNSSKEQLISFEWEMCLVIWALKEEKKSKLKRKNKEEEYTKLPLKQKSRVFNQLYFMLIRQS